MAAPTNTLSLSKNLVALAKSLFAHKTDANGHNLATQSKAGFMSPLDKAKLDGLSSGLSEIPDGSVTAAKLADVIDLGELSDA